MSLQLSVIVPVGSHRLNNLNLVLTSLECQTYPKEHWEVIVVNDGGEDDYLSVCNLHSSLDIKYVAQARHQPGNPHTTQPRNRGARNALSQFYVFADSDVILHPCALALYAEDFAANPDRIVVGMYHWLRPLRVTPADVRNHFDMVLNEEVRHAVIPNPLTHNISRDMREQLFSEQTVATVYRATPETRAQLYPKYLACFSGNIAWPAHLFWQIGGYWDELAAGAHEDGCSGLAACMAGIGLSFDRRIVGGHLFHERDVARIHALWTVEIPKINQRFALEDHADGQGPRDGLPSLQTMSAEALKAWGVDKWKTSHKSEDEATGFRGI